MSAMEPESGGRIVRVKGLPPKASAEDVVEFFDGFGLRRENVHFVSKEKRSAGEALVEFGNLQEAQRACTKDRDMFSPRKYGDRYVRVLLAEDVTPADLRSAEGSGSLSKQAPRNGRRSQGEAETVAKVCGLPPGITLQELLQLFWGLQAKAASTHILAENGGGVEAYVDFESCEHALRAISTRHGTMMTTAAGVFQLSVQRVSKSEWEGVVAQRQRSDGIVRLKGLPTKATAKDVLAFFKGFSVKKGGVHVQPQSENRHSKVAFVEFATPEEASRALSRDRQQFGEAFGDRYCLLQLVTRPEMETARAAFSNGHKNGSSSTSGGNGTGPSSSSGNGAATAAPGNGGGAHCASPLVPGPAAMLSPLGILPPGAAGIAPGMVAPGAAAAAAGFFGVPPATAGLLPQAMPGMPGTVAPSFQMPFPGLGHGLPPAPGMLPGHPPGLVPLPPGAAAGAPGLVGLPMQGPGLAWGGPAAARYMVQDLSTGQRVFLDPRFNVSYNPTESMAPWLQAQSQQSQSMSISEQSGGAAAAAASAGAAQAAQSMFAPFPMHGYGGAAMDGQVGQAINWLAAVTAPSNGGSGGSSNTQNGNGSNGSGSDRNGSGSDRGSDNDREGSDGDGGGGSSGKSGTDMPPPPIHSHPHLHSHHHHHAHHHPAAHAAVPLAPVVAGPHGAQLSHLAAATGLPPISEAAAAAMAGAAAHPFPHHPHPAHPHRAHAHAHPAAHPHSYHPHAPHHAMKHAASRGSTADPAAAQLDAMLQPLQKRCRSQE